MSFGLLGPLQVDGNVVALQRRDEVVFSALALRLGRAMTADQLADALWGDRPPPSWSKVVQGCVLRLRRALGPGLIETTPAGYRLTVGCDELDTRRFEQLMERGRLLAISGESERAVTAFGSALELWRGPPFTMLDGWPPGRTEKARLEELRRTAEECWLDARLQAGEHRDVAGIAQSRAAEEPLREHRWATLALAQYRCGQQADALRSLRRARQTLVEELGVEPGTELAELEAAILRQDDALAAIPERSAVAETCPYKGLASYDVDDADAFFGREVEVASCVARLRSVPLLVVTGPSGCGKSSLVRAGVVPALIRSGRTAAVMVPGSDPATALTSALASVDGTPVVVVDQFEELFTGDDHDVVRSFCRRLVEYCTIAPVVIAVRADHVASLAVDPECARLAEQGLHIVTPLTGDGLREAIEGPAALAGLRLESGLTDLLVRDTEGQSGALPLLSHALVETWRRRDGRVLTIAGYRTTGEISGAVARSADRLYERLPASQRPKLRSMLLRLVSTSPDGEPVRSRVTSRSLAGDTDGDRVLALLIRARLVTAAADSFELAHEALARAWPRLRSWLDEDAAGQRLLRHLSAAADGWDSLGRPTTELYRGARLDAVSEWRDAAQRHLAPGEVAFLDASAAAADDDRRQLARRACLQQRQNRRLRRLLASVAALLVVALVGGLLAFQQRQTARREERHAAIGELVGHASGLRSNRRDLAALLSVEAHRIAPSAATESALFGTFTAAPGATRTVHTGADIDQIGTGAVFVRAPDTLAVIDGLGAVHVVDLASGETREFEALAVRDDMTNGSWPLLATDANGRYLAAAWRPGTAEPKSPDDFTRLIVWDVASGERRFDPVYIPYRIGELVLSDDGSLVAIGGGYDGRVEIRDGATGSVRRELAPLLRPADAIMEAGTVSAAFAPDGTLIVGSQAGPIRRVDARTGAELQRIDSPQETTDQYLFISEDGATIITIGSRGAMGFDADSGEALWTEPHPLPYCPVWAYAERLGALLCGGHSGQVTAYDVMTGVDIGRQFDAQLGGVCSLAVSANGASFAEVSSCYHDATVVEWRLDGGGAVSRLVADTPRDHRVLSFGLGERPDALITELADAGDNELVTHIIDGTTGELLDRLPDIRQLESTGDPARAVAYFTADRTVGWYDPTRQARLGPGFAIGSDDLYQITVAGDVVLVTQFHDDWPVLHGVDLVSGQLGPPVVDGGGRFGVWHVAIGRDAFYTEQSGDLGYRVQRHDPETGAVLASNDGLTNVAANANTVIASTLDGRIVEIDPVTLEPVGAPFPGTNGLVDTLAIDAASGRLMAVGEDEALRFYDIATRTQLGGAIDLDYDVALRNLSAELIDEVATAALRGDGLMAAADTGQGIVVWDLDPTHWVDAACRLAGRNLTHAEWDQYVGDLAPYRRTCPAYPESA